MAADAVEDELVWELFENAPVSWSDDGPVLPADVDSWPPGPVLGALLAVIEVDRLGEADRVRFLRASERMVAFQQAASYRAMTAISDAYAPLTVDPAEAEAGAVLEIRAALRWTRRAAESELAVAHDLRVRLPQVHQALAEGRLDRRRAQLFVRHTEHLTVGQARTVTDTLIGEADRWTTGQLTERIRRACISADPADACNRYRRAVRSRRLQSWSNPDGTVTISGLELDAVRAQQALEGINRHARHLKTAAEPRSMDQLRADIFLDLLCGTTGPAGGSIHITVDLATLTALSEEPGELAGYGPVIADIARHTTRTLTDSLWTFTVTDPVTGLPVVDGHTRRRPTASQRRRVQRRSDRCIAPGCRMPAIGLDLDHRHGWAETGVTDSQDLVPLCRHDHCTRHQTGWRYTPIGDGDHYWTSPLGTHYTTSGRSP